MNNIESTIQNLSHLEVSASQNTFLNRLHPLIKLLVTLWYLILILSFSKYNLSGLLAMSLYPISLMLIGDFSLQEVFRSLKGLLLLLLVVGIANPFLDRQVISYLGSLPITGGMFSMSSLFMKGTLALAASYLLILTTSIEKICDALRLLHVPKLMVTLVLLIYRYLTVFLNEVNRITQAYALRAPHEKGIHYQAWGTLVGQLLLRSINRAELIYESMLLRGFDGTFELEDKQLLDFRSIFYGGCWFLILLILRFVPIFERVGEWLI